MRIEMLFSSTGEVLLLSVLLLIGALFILYGRGLEYVFVGMIIIGGVVSIGYENQSRYIQERFTLNSFDKGLALSCGLWRGESARVDRNSGWRYEEGTGFVKGDVIINDPGICRVIDKPFPEPSSVPYWIVLTTLMGILMILRSVILGVKEENDDARAE